MESPSTPQPYRDTNKVRNSWESELWDDHVACIFVSTTASLSVPLRVSGRVEIDAIANISGAGDLQILVDSSAQPFVSTAPGAQTITNFAVVDLSAGTHTVTITSSGGIASSIIKVRRGRVG